jgi:pyridoxamine 5'-phosphate oxidase
MESPELAAMRAEYSSAGLDEADAGGDPVALLNQWIAEAVRAYDSVGVGEPNAIAVATATPDGHPSVRMVLLKGFDARGLVFHTHRDSKKGRELAANPRAAAVLYWHPLQRQVRVEGPVEVLPDAESDAYFRTRPRGGQIGARASHQSEPIADRAALEQQVREVEAEFGDGPITRPTDWGGFRIGLDLVEFWQGRPDRLHDRLRYTRDGGGWRRERLQP